MSQFAYYDQVTFIFQRFNLDFQNLYGEHISQWKLYTIDQDDPDSDWTKETCLVQAFCRKSITLDNKICGCSRCCTEDMGPLMWGLWCCSQDVGPLMKVESTENGLISNFAPFHGSAFQWGCSSVPYQQQARWMRDRLADRFLMTPRHSRAVIFISTTLKICQNLLYFDWNHRYFSICQCWMCNQVVLA